MGGGNNRRPEDGEREQSRAWGRGEGTIAGLRTGGGKGRKRHSFPPLPSPFIISPNVSVPNTHAYSLRCYEFCINVFFLVRIETLRYDIEGLGRKAATLHSGSKILLFISFVLLCTAWPVGWNWVRKRGAKGQISSSHGRLQEQTFRPVTRSQSEPAVQSTLYDKGHGKVSRAAIRAAVRVCYERFQKPKRSGTWI